MSTSPYSQDLRQKVINFLEKGNSQKNASKIFDLHPNTISRWSIRYRLEGHCQARPRLGYKSKVDLENLQLMIKNKPNITLAELGKQLKISPWHSGRLLHKLGYVYKKKPIPMWKLAQKEELHSNKYYPTYQKKS